MNSIGAKEHSEEMFHISSENQNHYGLNTEVLTVNERSSIQPDSILFIDSAVEDYQSLIDNLTNEIEVVILDSTTDGILQITKPKSF